MGEKAPTWFREMAVRLDAQPEWFDGTPVCAEDKCHQYDGKRCSLFGFRPDRLCEPMVAEMSAALTEKE